MATATTATTATQPNRPDVIKSIRSGSLIISLKYWKANGDKPASHFIEIGQKGADDKWVNLSVNIADCGSVGDTLRRLQNLAIVREDGGEV